MIINHYIYIEHATMFLVLFWSMPKFILIYYCCNTHTSNNK